VAAGQIADFGLNTTLRRPFFEAPAAQSESFGDFKEAIDTIAQDVAATITWTADLAYAQACRQIRIVLQLQTGWDSYNAPAPSSRAGELAKRALDIIRDNFFAVPYIVASAEGGIATAFTINNKFAQLECLNSGSVLTTTFSRDVPPQVEEYGSDDASLRSAIETVRNFLFR
jgi:hypothetical protein